MFKRKKADNFEIYPKSWTKLEKGCFFMKYDLNFKLEFVCNYKERKRDFVPSGIYRSSFPSRVCSWMKTFNDLGIDRLKHNSFYKQWTVEQRFKLVAKVLSADYITNVAKNAHIDSGQLYQWVKKYREKGMDGLKCLKKGRPSKAGASTDIMPKKKIKLTTTEQEELKLLRERNKYLEAENLYRKN